MQPPPCALYAYPFTRTLHCFGPHNLKDAHLIIMPAFSRRDDSRKSTSWQAGAYLGITFALFSLALVMAVRRRISVVRIREADQRIVADARRAEVPYMWEVDISQGKGRMRIAPDEWKYWQVNLILPHSHGIIAHASAFRSLCPPTSKVPLPPRGNHWALSRSFPPTVVQTCRLQCSSGCRLIGGIPMLLQRWPSALPVAPIWMAKVNLSLPCFLMKHLFT